MHKLPWEVDLSDGVKKRVIETTQVQESHKVLDFGAGFGRYSDLFASVVGLDNVFVVEVDDSSIEKLVGKGYKNIHKPVDTKLPYPDDYFDVIFSSNVLEHIPRKEYFEYLSEIRRVLKPNCRFMVGIPSYPFKRIFDIRKAYKTKLYKYYLLDDPTHINKMNFITFEKHLKRFFSKVELEPTEVLFQNIFHSIKRNKYRYRIFSDKLVGYCVK